MNATPSTPPASGIRRRSFIKMLGGGVAVLVFSGNADAQRRGRDGGKPKDLSAWIHIAPDGDISVFTGKTEVGQNIRTSLAMVVAEELRVPLSSVRLVMADTDLVPWDAGTFGSRTTPDMASHLRRAAATAREALVGLAAARWMVERDGLAAADGQVTASDGSRAVSYGDLCRDEQLVAEIEGDTAVTAPDGWKILGTSVPKVDGERFVTGAHHFVSDLSRPGMVYGKVLRPPAFGAHLADINISGAESTEGAAVHRDGDFVGVTATDTPLAVEALNKIGAEWQGGDRGSNRDLFERLKASAGRDDAASAAIDQAMARAAHKAERSFTVEYIAHAPLEPRAAVAEWSGDGKLTVWTGTQRPFGVKDELMQAFSLPAEKVRVIVPDTGSGYGGKHTGECAVEAARLAKSAGKPVKLVWTREEEFTWAYFRPAGVMEVRGAIDSAGKLTAWEHHTYNPGGAGIETPYEVANRVIRSHNCSSPLRQGSYRGLGSAANCFARESLMDELAHAAKLDPLEFRLNNLGNPRLRAVLEAAAERFGWKDRESGENRGFGLACGTDKGGYLANFVELEMIDGRPKLRRITAAFECGAILHPEHLRQQISGSIAMGIGGALFEAIDFEDGRILNRLFSLYRMPRFGDVPDIELVLLDRKDLPSAGAGEAGILGIAPAIANAIFAATGHRHLALPMARA